MTALGIGHKPEARVHLLVTDPNDFSKKKLMRFTEFLQVSSTLSMTGVGTATVVLRNKSSKFFRGIAWPKWASVRADEVEQLRSVLRSFRDQVADYRYETEIGKIIDDKELIYPWVNPMDLLWIDYRGRDGHWYSGFTGVVTGYSDQIRAHATPTFTITAKDFRRILQNIPVVTGQMALADRFRFETLLTQWQAGSIPITSLFAAKEPSTVVAESLEIVNRILNIQPKEERNFWKFKGTDDIALFQDLAGDKPIAPYEYAADEFDPFSAHRTEDPDEATFYHNPIAHGFMDAVFSDGPSVYQLILRSQLDAFSVDLDYILSILNRVAQATLAVIYVDQLGNLRYEYPRYATFPSDDPDPAAWGSKYRNGNFYTDFNTPFHGRNYYVTSQDASFMDYKGGEDESQIVATRVSCKQSLVIGGVTPGAATEKMVNMGFAVAPEVDLLRFGLRETNVQPFYVNTILKREVLDAYAQSVMTYLNAQAHSFTVTLDQRPDLMLNRSLVFADRARVGLITDIADTYSPSGGHTRTATCRYARYVGAPIEYPWEDLLSKTVEELEEETSP